MNNSIFDLIDDKLTSDLEEMIKEEAEKRSPDIDRLNELTDMLADIHDENHEKAIWNIVERAADQRIAARNNRIIRRISAIAACAVLLLGLNQVSLNTYGENVFSRVYHFTKGGINIMIGEDKPTEAPAAPAEIASQPEEVIELPTYPGDPYGIKAVCAKYGLYPMTPSYIPEGFKLVDLSENDSSISMHLVFRFVKEEKRINLYYIYPKDENDSFALPTDSGNIMELTINNQLFTVSNDNNLSKAFYIDGKMICNLCTYNIDYAETNKILYSFS